ncbi:MAG: cryptochrome/photolyase family protein [Gammaproteobacteria bacterium]|nr:cryptochrome/photolyase family protein [Gammaproteobacteria bacterium]
MRPTRHIATKINKTTRRLRLILGDQLNAQHSWFQEKDPTTLYLIAELPQETRYVKHHVQKVCAFFAAMEAFAYALAKAGHQVLYLTLDETQDFSSLTDLLEAVISEHQLTTFEYQHPDEYRLSQQLQAFAPTDIHCHAVDSEHFYLPREAICDYFEPRQHRTMEFFYRQMRKRFNILVEQDQPLGGRWNFDHDNRNALNQEALSDIPQPLLFANDVTAILQRLERHQVVTFGSAQAQLIWPINRRQSRALLAHFCQYLLPLFGRYQDAMTAQSKHAWSLYHSRLSFALNAKIISPREVINCVIKTWQENQATIEINQVEGFVRQILGWREYVRGVYWANMPEYRQLNALHAKRSLPDYFWTGATQMNCLKQCLTQSLDYAYAHHIQRLMIIGNFCLLTGIDPDQVDAWYLGVYIDAIEWVEMPNTRGMTQFADNGIVATKPYAASANYIKKMSDYCQNCHYQANQKVGARACPLNSLYWHFLARHQQRFENNQRMRMIYRNWARQSSAQQDEVLQQAEHWLAQLDQL